VRIFKLLPFGLFGIGIRGRVEVGGSGFFKRVAKAFHDGFLAQRRFVADDAVKGAMIAFYKTWELSLAGFLVAANIFHKRSKENPHWSIPSYSKESNFDVLPEIRTACDEIKSYDAFVARLASICEPDAKVFDTFAPALKNAYDLLPSFWATLNNPKLNQQDRRAASLERIEKLEREGISDKFYEEFSQSIHIKELLAKIPQQPQQD
jgi:hypothetical protein